MNATNKRESVSKLMKAWESKNAKRAAQGAGLTTMAVTLAACGGEDTTPFDQSDIDAATTPIQTALTDALSSLAAATTAKTAAETALATLRTDLGVASDATTTEMMSAITALETARTNSATEAQNALAKLSAVTEDLGLASDATAADMIEAITALETAAATAAAARDFAQAGLAELRIDLGLTSDATVQDMVSAITALEDNGAMVVLKAAAAAAGVEGTNDMTQGELIAALTESNDTAATNAAVAVLGIDGVSTLAELAAAYDALANPGDQDFVLTTNVDAGAAFTGGNGNDTFFAQMDGADDTFNTGDHLRGGAGDGDKLELLITSGANNPIADLVGIEVVDIRNTQPVTLDGTFWDGVNTFVIDRSSAVLTVQNLAALPSVEVIRGNGSWLELYVDPNLVDLSGDADVLHLSLTDANTLIEVSDDNTGYVEIVNITNTGDSVLDQIFHPDDILRELNVSGSGTLDMTGMVYKELTSVTVNGVDLSIEINNLGSELGTDTTFAATGGAVSGLVQAAKGTATNAAVTTISLGDGDNVLEVNGEIGLQTIDVTTGSGDDQVAAYLSYGSDDGSTASFDLGAGDDSLLLDRDADIEVTVHLGAGNDILNTDHGGFISTDTIDGGAGFDTLRGSSANLAAISADADQVAALSGFEQLAVTDALADNINVAAFGLSAISLETVAASAGLITAGSGVTVSFDSTVTTSVTSGMIEVAVVGASAAGSNDDVVNLEVNADFDGGAADVVVVTVSVLAVETLNIVTTDSLVDEVATLNGGENFVVTVEDGNVLETITVNAGAGLATEVNEGAAADFTNVTNFNASVSTGGVTVAMTNAAQGVTMVGGSGSDDFSGSAFADSISGGAGDDTITGSFGADTLTGGAGDDTFVNDAIALNGIDIITDFATTVDNITLSIADLNALTSASTFNAGNGGVAAQGGTFLQIIATDGAGAATAAATGAAGTFIYDSNTGNLIFDASGDTTYTDDGTGFTDASGDDIVFADLGAGGLGTIVDGDILFIA